MEFPDENVDHDAGRVHLQRALLLREQPGQVVLLWGDVRHLRLLPHRHVDSAGKPPDWTGH